MTALCSGKICTIFPEKGALNFWKACTIALEYSIQAGFGTADIDERYFYARCFEKAGVRGVCIAGDYG